MARSSQTFQKRQRENKLREKAQLKRERRQQRQMERKASKSPESADANAQSDREQFDPNEGNGPEIDFGSVSWPPGQSSPAGAGTTSYSAAEEAAEQLGGNMAAKLFIGNLPRTVTDAGLSDFVTNAGFRVASALVVRDKMTGDPRGFGFVELAEGEDLQRAIAGLDGHSMEGRPLTVNEARPQRTGFSGPRGGGRGRFDRRRDY